METFIEPHRQSNIDNTNTIYKPLNIQIDARVLMCNELHSLSNGTPI